MNNKARVQILSGALASVSKTLILVGLGTVTLGKISRHMLKLRHHKHPDATPQPKEKGEQ